MSKFWVDNTCVVLTRRRGMKSLRLCVRPDGDLGVSAPPWARKGDIVAFVRSHSSWITEQQHLQREKNVRLSQALLPGQQVCLWGQMHTVAWEGEEARNMLLLDSTMPEDAEARWDKLHRRYRIEMETALPDQIAQCENALGVRVQDFRLRVMRSRWGSCQPRTARLCFNVQLAAYPPECLHYVVVHECAHLIEARHNARFWGIVSSFCPGWRDIRQQLRQPLPGVR